MKAPKMIELTEEQIDALLQRVKNNTLQPGDDEIIKGLWDTVKLLKEAYDNKTASIKRLLRMIFGARTEKTTEVFKPDEKNASEDKRDDGGDDSSKEDAERAKPKDPSKKKPKGHGRNGADAFTGAEKEFVSNPNMKPGDPCQLCDGKVYNMKKPGLVIRIFAKAPVQAKVWEYEKYRCHLCGAIFTPDLPEEAKEEKYDETAIAMIALSKYGFGLPFYRLEKLQDCLGIPLPASTQWDKVEAGADRIYPAFEELKRQAAQGDVLHNDDTTIKILELMKDNDDPETQTSRKGMFTTGIVSVKDDLKMALFFTGRKHAGENMAEVLEKRDSDRPPPIQMCDALSRNFSECALIILTHCNTHARRNFVNVAENFPQACRHVLKVFEKIYKNDAIAKNQGMSAQERLEFHQEHSGPVMEKFHKWLQEQLDEKKVEPNSGLGQAISYMLEYWLRLTRFLHVPGAPLDNNICEQALKRAILNRKNSLFYKTLHGAYVGDMYMSLIHTCILNGANPFDYLVALQMHSSKVFKNPAQWMPWNYESTISSLSL